MRYIGCVVGDGARIRLWHEIRCGNYALKELYPYLNSIAVDKHTSLLFFGKTGWRRASIKYHTCT